MSAEWVIEARAYAGVDWGSQIHCVFLTDGAGRKDRRQDLQAQWRGPE